MARVIADLPRHGYEALMIPIRTLPACQTDQAAAVYPTTTSTVAATIARRRPATGLKMMIMGEPTVLPISIAIS